MEGAGVVHIEADHVVHLGQGGVVPGQLHRRRVQVPAPDLIVPLKLLVHGLVRRLEPQLLVHTGPLLGGEGAVQAGGPVFGDEGGLDGDGPRPAEGVAQGVPSPVPGQEHHGRRQGLPQGGGHPLGPVAPLVEARPGGVQHQDGLIPHDGELHLVEGSGLRQGVQAVLGPQTGGDGLLNDGLAGGHRAEGGVEAVALHRELPLPGDEALPGQGPGALKQGVEVGGREGAQHQQHPLPGAQVQIQTGEVQGGALAEHPPVLRPDLVQAQAAQFIGGQALHPEQGGDGKSQLLRHGGNLLKRRTRASCRRMFLIPPQYTGKQARSQFPRETLSGLENESAAPRGCERMSRGPRGGAKRPKS